MLKIGLITVGQSPRVDVTSDILPILGDGVELIEAGALDEMTDRDFDRIAPKDGDYILVSRLRDGSQVCFTKRHILPIIQELIYKLEAQDVTLIVLLCTGELPKFKSDVPLIYSCDILEALVPVISGGHRIAIIVPDCSQKLQNKKHWEKFVNNPYIVAASPYGCSCELDIAIDEINEKAQDATFVVMDCVGYSLKMKQHVFKKTGKRVILARTILAHVIKELDIILYK